MGFINAMDAYTGTLPSQLSHRSARHSAIAANIANVDTPGYKAVDVGFKQHLERAGTIGMSRTDAMHLGSGAGGGTDTFELVEVGGYARRDGNDVNIDNEMVKLAKNQLEYRFLTQMLKGKFDKLRSAIAGRPIR